MSQKAIAYNAMIDCYLIEEVDQKIVIGLAFEALSMFGIVLEKKGLAQATGKALAKLKDDPRKTPEALSTLPMTTDSTEEACVKIVLKKVLVCLICGTTEYIPLLIIEATDRMVEKGQSKLSSAVFALMGFLVTNVLGDAEQGRSHAINARKHLELHEVDEVKAVVNWFNEVTTMHWTEPIQTTHKHLFEGYKAGLSNGDLTWAMWNIHFYVEYAFFSGTNLDLLQNDITIGNQTSTLSRIHPSVGSEPLRRCPR